jgi:hypothetical protein
MLKSSSSGLDAGSVLENIKTRWGTGGLQAEFCVTSETHEFVGNAEEERRVIALEQLSLCFYFIALLMVVAMNIGDTDTN